jgi:hypothetical protein
MPRDLVPASPGSSLAELLEVGALLAKSGYFRDAKTEAQAVAKVLAGAELGLAPVASLRSIHILDGQVALSAHLMAGLIKRSRPRYDYAVLEWTGQVCRLEFFDHGERVGESSFSLADANTAGVGQRDNWRHYPRNMLYARAMANGARMFCSDLFLGGVYTPEELGDAASAGLSEPDSPLAVLGIREPVQDDPTIVARRHFWATARRPEYGLWHEGITDAAWSRAVHRALGLPEEPGALRAFAAREGWDVARHLLEDGQTVASLPPESLEDDPLPDVSEADFWQAVGPDGLGLTWNDVRAALGLPEERGALGAWLAAGHSYAEARAIVERGVFTPGVA